MGAITFSLDPRLVSALKTALPLNVLVETGTFKGDTPSAFASWFNKVISIELSETLFTDAVKRFSDSSNVQILQGSSSDKLQDLRYELKDIGVLYWLDAHWCVATETEGVHSQCPLLNELAAIHKLNINSVILIDDARLFLAPPLAPHEISQWPNLSDILRTLQTLSTVHDLMVINDVIVFYPPVAKLTLMKFAQFHGVDWLLAAETFKEHQSLANELKDKELCISAQNESLVLLSGKLKEKEAVIQDQRRTIRAYAAAYGGLSIFQPIARLVRRAIEIFLPRLGNLDQYQPRPITRLKSVKPVEIDSPLRISIVTPSFNQGAFISRTIQSVINQQYPSLEYFVQDGGSGDSTIQTLKQLENALSGWESVKDSGQSEAINRAFRKTTGDIMAWINSDDLLLPGSLQTVANYFSDHPDVDVVYGDRLLINENNMEIGRWLMPGHDSAVLNWVDYVPQETMFWRRSIWERVGGQIDETFHFAMDWDLLVRFSDAGANFAHIPRFLGAFRIHEQQKTSAEMNQVGQEEMDRIRARQLGRVPTQPEVKKAITSFLVRHIFVDLRYRVRVRLRGER